MAKTKKKAKAAFQVKAKPSKTASLKSSKPPAKDKNKIKSTDKKSSLKKAPLKEKLKLKKGKKAKEQNSGKAILRKSTSNVMPVKQPPIKLSKEMQEIRQRLQQMLGDMRRDIDHEVRGASERDLAHINDTSDMASDAAEGDLALRIAESETVEASEIERAIEKIDTGTYGVCESCNQQIGAGRLEFLPYVTLCIKCQELAEIKRREEGDELDDLAEGAEQDAENN